jgi:hypothetical protein
MCFVFRSPFTENQAVFLLFSNQSLGCCLDQLFQTGGRSVRVGLKQTTTDFEKRKKFFLICHLLHSEILLLFHERGNARFLRVDERLVCCRDCVDPLAVRAQNAALRRIKKKRKKNLSLFKAYLLVVNGLNGENPALDPQTICFVQHRKITLDSAVQVAAHHI